MDCAIKRARFLKMAKKNISYFILHHNWMDTDRWLFFRKIWRRDNNLSKQPIMEFKPTFTIQSRF